MDFWLRGCLAGPLGSTEKFVQAPSTQALGVFSTVVAIISVGSLVVTVQAKVRLATALLEPHYLSSRQLLGGRVYGTEFPVSVSWLTRHLVLSSRVFVSLDIVSPH